MLDCKHSVLIYYCQMPSISYKLLKIWECYLTLMWKWCFQGVLYFNKCIPGIPGIWFGFPVSREIFKPGNMETLVLARSSRAEQKCSIANANPAPLMSHLHKATEPSQLVLIQYILQTLFWASQEKFTLLRTYMLSGDGLRSVIKIPIGTYKTVSCSYE
jgi:hypothetical protein